MRWICAVVLLLVACQPGGDPTARPSPSNLQALGTDQAPEGLAAAEPELPSLSAFRRRAQQACATATAAIASNPLRGDPLRPQARGADVHAAVAHYRAAAAAWTAAAGDLWDFGIPKQKVGQKLITALDTLAQYDHQAAELLRSGDSGGAQAALGAVHAATNEADRFAQRLGIGRLQDCGPPRPSIRRSRPVAVTAQDFSFSAEDVAAGPTRFVLTNAGREPHHLFVVRLAQAGTLNEAVRADRRQSSPGEFLRRQSAVSVTADPGTTTALDMRLKPGPYGLLCFVASEDGTPHAYKGMALEIDVRG